MGWRDLLPWTQSEATAFLSLGSNLGDRLDTLSAAVRDLDRPDDVQVETISSVYETAPDLGDLHDDERRTQDPFLNLVAAVTTTRSPRELLELAHRIEADHGRDRARERRWGPRTLDIDILLYEDRSIDEPDLRIPHPRMTQRGFVLVPLAEIMPPGATLPDGTSLARHIAALAPIEGIERYVRLQEGPGVQDDPLRRRPAGPSGGPPRLGPAQGGEGFRAQRARYPEDGS